MDDFCSRYFVEVAIIAQQLNLAKVELLAQELGALRQRGGRLFILGVGGSAANASHAVNDFRKICGIEAYAPSDNVAELTARINDEGWDSCYAEWLKGSRFEERDAVLIFSVGGGSVEKRVSTNLVRAIDFARSVGGRVLGVVGRDGGYTAQVGDAVVLIPTLGSELVTPQAESFQAVVWHCLVSHPLLKRVETKWESIV